MDLINTQFAFIGLGKVGTNLARFAHQSGIRISTLKDPYADFSELIRETGQLYRNRINPDTTHIIIAVPDSSIRLVAEELAGENLDFETLFVAHTSGLLTSDELEPLQQKGAACGSFHPIQSFVTPRMDKKYLHAISCGIEGSDSFMQRAEELAHFLQWKPLRIRKEDKVLYHSACVFAGNFLSVLRDIAGSLLLKSAPDAKEGSDHFLPMMLQVLERDQMPWSASGISGPAARGDRATLQRHLQALTKQATDIAGVYSVLSEFILANYSDEGRQSKFDSIFEKHPRQ